MTKKTDKKITIKLKQGLMGCTPIQRQTVAGLGLKHRHAVKTLENTSAVRGMIKKVIHMIEIVSQS